jgi:hypothetical protein
MSLERVWPGHWMSRERASGVSGGRATPDRRGCKVTQRPENLPDALTANRSGRCNRSPSPALLRDFTGVRQSPMSRRRPITVFSITTLTQRISGRRSWRPCSKLPRRYSAWRAAAQTPGVRSAGRESFDDPRRMGRSSERMSRRGHSPEQVARKLREADRLLAEGMDGAAGRVQDARGVRADLLPVAQPVRRDEGRQCEGVEGIRGRQRQRLKRTVAAQVLENQR